MFFQFINKKMRDWSGGREGSKPNPSSLPDSSNGHDRSVLQKEHVLASSLLLVNNNNNNSSNNIYLHHFYIKFVFK